MRKRKNSVRENSSTAALVLNILANQFTCTIFIMFTYIVSRHVSEVAQNAESSGVSPKKVVWKCPICLRIPPAKIYQCSSGHSFCDACILHKKSCPKCDVKMFGSKHGFYGVRNVLPESLLNQMKFECRWEDQGCKTLETRSQISKHEYICIYR